MFLQSGYSGLLGVVVKYVILDIYFSTAQKMKFVIKDFLSKCDQIRRFLRI